MAMALVVGVLNTRGGPVGDELRLVSVPTGTVPIGFDLRLDGLAAAVAVAVGVVAFLVQLYSTAYLREDPRYSSYAAFVSLFTAR
jgi:NADH-quinone oxidoreductase subunit L